MDRRNLLFDYTGQTLVEHRSNTGQTLVKYWSNTGQAGTMDRRNLRAASRALGLRVEIGSEEEAILQVPNRPMNYYYCKCIL
jgi:hypothetical protein